MPSNKDFSDWHKVKTAINNGPKRTIYFYEKEVWWVAIGKNIGFEEDGKGVAYIRPVVVMRKFSQSLFLGVPLSTTPNRGRYYYPFIYNRNKESVALLSQLRVFDAKRLLQKTVR